jgi:dihydroxyacetone kinase-like protein
VKKLINDREDAVADALRGRAAAHPDLRVDHQHRVIHRRDAPRPGKVGIVSGGGSGHEPLHGGFVGPGLPTRPVPGRSSPRRCPTRCWRRPGSRQRRGVGATVLAEKIAGAAAEQGRPLEEVADVARKVNANSRSMDVALTSCTVPAAGTPTFQLGADDMELGVGIHGEPGRRRVPLAGAREIAALILEPVLADLAFRNGDHVLAFTSGQGSSATA